MVAQAEHTVSRIETVGFGDGDGIRIMPTGPRYMGHKKNRASKSAGIPAPSMTLRTDKALGMQRDITRRDFLNSSLLASGGLLMRGTSPMSKPPDASSDELRKSRRVMSRCMPKALSVRSVMDGAGIPALFDARFFLCPI